MVIYKELNSSFERNRSDTFITNENARRDLEKYGLWEPYVSQILAIISWEKYQDVHNSEVTTAIKDAAEQINRQSDIAEDVYKLAA